MDRSTYSNSCRFSLAFLAALLACLLLAACGDSDSAQKEGGASADADENAPWKIGVVVPLSSNLAAYGSSTLDGVQMMAEKINASGGILGRPVELIVENNEGDKTKSAASTRKLIGMKKVLAIIGPITSTNALEIGRDAQKKGVVLITPTGTNDAITTIGDHVFRACFTDSFQGISVAKFAAEDLKVATAVAFQDTTSDYSVGLCKEFIKTFNALGGKALPTFSYKQSDTEFTPQLRKIRELGAGAIFIPGYPPELPLIINEARSLKMKAILLGADGWDNADVLNNSGRNLDAAYFAAAFSAQMTSSALDEFLALSKKNKIDHPGSFEALGYDSLGLLAEAIKAAKIADDTDLASQRQAIRQALASAKDYKGATGAIAMQPSGDPLKNLVILKYALIDGKIEKTFVKTFAP